MQSSNWSGNVSATGVNRATMGALHHYQGSTNDGGIGFYIALRVTGLISLVRPGSATQIDSNSGLQSE